MTGGEFRCVFHARDYDSSVAFYRDGLGLLIVEEWDHGPDDQGTVFGAASGLIEVLRVPANPAPEAAWDYSKPQGIMVAIETDDVDAWYKRSVDKGLSVRQGLTVQPWGHRTFLLNDPNGVTLYIFSKPA
jgi:catechol 2,3-dioxygenase-like lactoylglutathione lyase family enzyme